MKLKSSVVAVLLAFSTTAAWAADSDSVQYIDDATPTQAVGTAPSSSIENAADDQTGWQYLNGQQATASASAGGSDQDQSAKQESFSGDDQAASPEDTSGDQSAMWGDTGDIDQSASNEESSSGDDQSASSEDTSDSKQSAMSEDESDSDQSAAAADEGGNDQVAEDSAGEDLMAMAGPQSRAGTFKPTTLEDFKAATQDKLVVILPTGWQGSLKELIASLEDQSDAAEILILSQDDPDNSDSDQ
jgi:hypothetical protein